MNIYAIIVTYNGSKWIDKCFGSLENSSIPVKILAIDNGSTDGTPTIIREKYPQVEVIETGKNLGFGKANNIGLKRVLDKKVDYAFLLNQDAWVEEDTLEKLIALHSKNQNFGIISPMEYSSDKNIFDFAFQYYIQSENCPNLYTDLTNKKLKQIYPCNFINAAGWLLPFQTILKVGGFDPIFPHYGEDWDYIQRVKYHGYKIGISTDSNYYHDRNKNNNETRLSAYRLFIHYLALLKNPFSPLIKELINFYIVFLKKIIKDKRGIKKNLNVILKITTKLPAILKHRSISTNKESAFL